MQKKESSPQTKKRKAYLLLRMADPLASQYESEFDDNIEYQQFRKNLGDVVGVNLGDEEEVTEAQEGYDFDDSDSEENVHNADKQFLMTLS